uniref:Uncharacterized protein n=1 Tax=Arundo donax TaxID=35708 RepID=A0A0A8Z1E8_ARUDO
MHTTCFLLDTTTTDVFAKHGWRFTNMFVFDVSLSLLSWGTIATCWI